MRKLQKDTAQACRVLKAIIHRIDSGFNAFHNRHDAPFVTIIVCLSWQKGKIHVLTLRYFIRYQHYWCWLSRQIRKSTLLVLTLQAHSEKQHCRCWQSGRIQKNSIAIFYLCSRKNQWILHRTANFRKSALSVCNVDSLILLILCENSRKLVM